MSPRVIGPPECLAYVRELHPSCRFCRFSTDVSGETRPLDHVFVHWSAPSAWPTRPRHGPRTPRRSMGFQDHQRAARREGLSARLLNGVVTDSGSRTGEQRVTSSAHVSLITARGAGRPSPAGSRERERSGEQHHRGRDEEASRVAGGRAAGGVDEVAGEGGRHQAGHRVPAAATMPKTAPRRRVGTTSAAVMCGGKRRPRRCRRPPRSAAAGAWTRRRTGKPPSRRPRHTRLCPARLLRSNGRTHPGT
jgi:hypothetical protein